MWSDEKYLFPLIGYKMSLDNQLCFRCLDYKCSEVQTTLISNPEYSLVFNVPILYFKKYIINVLHPSKVKWTALSPILPRTRGTLGITSSDAVAEKTSKGSAALATAHGLGGACRACEARAGTGSQLPAPG